MESAEVAMTSANDNDLNEKAAKVQIKDHSDSEEELFQDVVSQFPFLNGYSHVAFMFQPEPDISRETIIATVQDGLDKLTDQIPWLAGQVMHTSGPAGSSGLYALAPWPSEAPKNDMIRIKDCEDIMPPIAQILRASAPISMLDAKVLTPFPSLPVPHGLKPPLPVMVFQINFLRGGIIINMSTHHMAVDGTGIVQIMRHLSTVLQGHKIFEADVEQANRDRRRVVPLIPRGEPVKDHNYLRAPSGYVTAPPSSPPKWCYFKMPVSALPALEKLASSQQLQQQQLSENDILSAFCWQRITAVRLARGFPPDTMTKMTRTIDGRAVVGVPITYMGHLTYFSVSQLPMGQVASLPLSTIAQTLRRELSAANTTWAIRSYATFLAREPDKSRLVYAGLRNLDTDLGTTAFIASQSTRQEDSSAMPHDFGSVLGHLKYTRRPNSTPLPGGITVCPVESGAIPLLLCMPEADLEGLKKDTQWRRFVRYVG
ncbi:hypothetical protein K505DRAFT_325744 [Melanomma pulvis-pyrius CBS 109.77]|uniref:Trichothecene 3-O-acetyltransferase-like N-terminal domain-containing protein n=1 Tax=Melanomma pulvis-pyrius CBS 109.77 TaxID=1314802 RepID=A0A6A6X9F3_9PLEO|nr:hypothetical protein K505DRAFT_325744 [Melanomma pulvis-pyrius CBS 109.77]